MTGTVFAAVVPPQEALAALGQAIDAVRAATDIRLRWTRPATWHLTLAFYGRPDDDVVAALVPRLARVAARSPAPALRVAGAGAFPRVSRARVLWAGATGDLVPLGRIASSAVAAGRRVGLSMPPAPFRAHVTLARAREPSDLTEVVSALQALDGPPWRPAELVLLAGPPTSGAYRVRERWPLRGAS